MIREFFLKNKIKQTLGLIVEGVGRSNSILLFYAMKIDVSKMMSSNNREHS